MDRTWRTRCFVALALLLLIGASAFLLSSRPPRYAGRSLRQWLDALPNVPNASFPSRASPPDSAADALQHMGPSAVPFLIKMVNARDSSFSDKMKTFLDRQGLFRLPYHHAGDEQIEAPKGLSALGAVAKPAIPAVAKLIRDGEGNPERALVTLARIGPDAIRALVELLQNTNKLIRCSAAGYLGNFREHGKTIVPRLITCLDDPDESLQDAAASALGGFGHKARPAIPKLLQLAHSKPYESGAIYTLMTIDYDGTLRTLIAELHSTDAQVRARAASIFGRFEHGSACAG
jgi:hypothetical protein